MSPRFRCNTCQGTYSDTQPDGSRYFHACSPLTVPGAQPDPSLPGFTPPTFEERHNKRDENLRDGIIVEEGKQVFRTPDPLDPTRIVDTPVVDPEKHRGPGRTAI